MVWSFWKKTVAAGAAAVEPKDTSSLKESVKAVKSASGTEKTRQIDVLLYDRDSNSMEQTVGILSNFNNFLLCPYTNGVYMGVKTFWKNGRQTALVSRNYHHVQNLKLLDDWVNQVNARYKISLKYEDIVAKMDFKEVTSQIDPGFYDNTWSQNFASEASIITRTPLLQMILDAPQSTLLYLVTIAGLICFIAGAGAMGILAVLIGWWK